MSTPKRAIILAGGKGTRLYPYTTVFPKPLMPVGEKPILEIVFKQLKHFGIEHITIAVGYLAELIQTYFGDGSKFGLKIDYSREESPLGTAGPIKLAGKQETDFLMMNGDILCSLDFGDMFRSHIENDCIATIGTYKKEVKIDLGVLELSPHGQIIDYIEKPTLYYDVSMGIYYFKPEIYDYIEEAEVLDLPDLMKRLMKQKVPINSYQLDGHWLDIGRQEDYAHAQKFLDDHYKEFNLD